MLIKERLDNLMKENLISDFNRWVKEWKDVNGWKVVTNGSSWRKGNKSVKIDMIPTKPNSDNNKPFAGAYWIVKLPGKSDMRFEDNNKAYNYAVSYMRKSRESLELNDIVETGMGSGKVIKVMGNEVLIRHDKGSSQPGSTMVHKISEVQKI